MLRSPFTWLALLAVLILAGPRMCSSPPAGVPDVGKAAPPVTPVATLAPPGNPWGADGPGAIVSVSPERLRLVGDEIAPQTLDVSYRIREPESALEAWLELQVSVVGKLARMDVPIQATGSVRFDVSSGGHSLGPHVQFRAICPQGPTEWHSLGTPPPLPSARVTDVLQIDHVSPGSINWSLAMDPAYGGGHGAIRVSISGRKLTGDCRVETQVNRSSVELRSVRFTGRRFEGLLRYEDFNYDEVAPRYADLKLVVRRKGSRMAASRTMPFD